MSYKVTNRTGGQLVCDLAVKGKTLRLNNRQSTTINDNEITPHLRNLESNGLVLVEYVSDETKTTKKKTTRKNSQQEKEE